VKAHIQSCKLQHNLTLLKNIISVSVVIRLFCDVFEPHIHKLVDSLLRIDLQIVITRWEGSVKFKLIKVFMIFSDYSPINHNVLVKSQVS
jgi:hypothetical protein